MLDGVEALGSATSQDPQKQYQLQQLTEQNETEQVRSSQFSQLAETAMSHALESQNSRDDINSLRSGMTNGTGGAVGAEKDQLVSRTARGDQTQAEQTYSDEMQTLVHRTRALYRDMTVHHVAWGVAMRMQKDISQLLRGG